MNGSRHALAVASLTIGVALLASTADAQVRYGSIVVVVVDQTGGALPGATVTVTQTQTNLTRTAVSNEIGTATLASLPPGQYTVRVNLTGFRESVTAGVSVSEDSLVRVSSRLEVGQIADAVTVTADVAVLQTDRADVRTELPAAQLENLPVPVGRNYQNLFVTIPGVSPPENMHSVAVNPARGLAFSSNGTTRNANSIRIEGAISNNLWLPHVAAYVPALEAIESVGVTTSTFDADEGLSGGMAANVLIKSGTNEFRGSGFAYFFNESMKSRPFFLPSDEPKPETSQHQLGGTLGGPMVRNRLFFFSSYQGTRDRQLAQRFGTVPIAAMRAGDFSASPTPIYDPSTGDALGRNRTPFQGNIIPQNRMDPIALRLLQGLPLPNQPGLTNNYFATGDYTFDRHNVDAKVNLNANDRLRIAARVGWLGYNFSNPAMFGPLGGLPVNATAFKAGTGLGDTYTITTSASYVVSPTFFIDAYSGVTLIEVLSEPDRMEENLGLDFLGIPGTNGPDRLYGGWPHFSISNYSNLGYSGSNNSPYVDDNWQVQFTANATWTHGTHTLRFGGDIVRQAMNRHELGNGSGSFSFAGGPTAQSGGPSVNQFNSFASFLLGLPTGVSKSIIPFENGYTRTRNWQFSFFVKDHWQPTPNLTASLGLRYDYFPMGTRTTRGLERYDLENNVMLICGVGSIPTDCGYDIPPGNFSPRVGLAYRLTPQMVLRGGYGINYDPYPLAFVRNLIGNYPSSIGLSLPQANSFQPAGTLAAGIPEIPVPDISSGVIAIPGNIGARALPQDPTRGYIQSWNITLQSQLPGGFTGQAGYVGTRQRDINQIMDANAGQVIGAGNAGRPLQQRFGRSAATGILSNPGWSNYDSLQTALSRRMANGVQVNVAYTWSKAFGICCDTLSDNPPQVQALDYFELNEARLPQDRPHNYQASFVVELPFGQGKPRLNQGGALSRILGGWQVNGLFSAYSGTPFTVTSPGNSLNMPGSNQMADRVKSEVEIYGFRQGQPYFDTTAFSAVTEPRFGTAGFNSMRGPGFVNFDMGVFRQFTLGGARTLQFRLEIFNLTNTAHFANPQGNVTASNFGVITSTANSGREGIDERLFRVGFRLGF